MFHRNLLSVLDPSSPLSYCVANRIRHNLRRSTGGSWCVRMAEQSPLTGYEPNSLIEVTSEHTLIHFPSRQDSFSTDIDDVTVAANH